MNQIDRLTIKAKKLAAGGLSLCVAVVRQKDGRWVSLAHLWDGKTPAFTMESEHSTKNAAISHLHSLARKYPNRDDISIIVLDV